MSSEIAGLALAAAALTVACAARGTAGGGQSPAELAFEPILSESVSGLNAPLREVVRDGERWARLWEQVYSGVTPRPARPAVDFSRHMLIVVAAGTRPTGGFDIAVRSVAVRDTALDVVVLESCPAPGARAIMALTQPLEVVLLDRLPQAPTFRETRAPSCR